MSDCTESWPDRTPVHRSGRHFCGLFENHDGPHLCDCEAQLDNG